MRLCLELSDLAEEGITQPGPPKSLPATGNRHRAGAGPGLDFQTQPATPRTLRKSHPVPLQTWRRSGPLEVDSKTPLLLNNSLSANSRKAKEKRPIRVAIACSPDFEFQAPCHSPGDPPRPPRGRKFQKPRQCRKSPRKPCRPANSSSGCEFPAPDLNFNESRIAKPLVCSISAYRRATRKGRLGVGVQPANGRQKGDPKPLGNPPRCRQRGREFRGLGWGESFGIAFLTPVCGLHADAEAPVCGLHADKR